MSSNVEVLPGGGGEKRRSRARGVAKAMGSIAVAAARGSAKGVAVIGSKVSSSRKGVQKISAGDDPNAPPMAMTPESSPKKTKTAAPVRSSSGNAKRSLVYDETVGNGAPMSTQEHATVKRSYGTI
eukprot:m.129203 g.129203  ORF g.129203 m.129203 type:complete len:126 (+) comp13662_c0_seq3:392-769(+)